MVELEWLRRNLVAPGLLPGPRLEAWLADWSPERPLLRHLVERGVLDAGGAGTLSAAIKGYLRVDSAVLVGLFRGASQAVPEPTSGQPQASPVDVPKDRSMPIVSDATSASSQVRAAVDAALSGTWPAPTPRVPRARREDDMSEVIAQGLRGVLAAAQAWSSGMSLRPKPLPAGLQSLAGELRGTPLRMTTRREQGGPFTTLTCSTICGPDGAPCCVTLIGLPAAGMPVPVLGIDLIGLGGALSLVAVDLAPIDRPFWELRAAAPLAALHTALGERVVARRWPGFAEEVFSPQAVIVGVRRGAEAEVLTAVADFVARLPAVYAPGPSLPSARREAADERARAWRRAELRNRREHDALTRMFGAEPATAFLAALFGD